MGTWGTAIFSDDLASDIKSEFRNKIGLGKTSQEATNEILDDYVEEINDQDDSSVFWLSLASTQWNLGRLLDSVKVKALEIIESGQDLKRWKEDDKELKKRKLVLEKLKIQLLSEQPKPKKIAKPFIRETTFEKGDLISYQLKNDKFIILKVIQIRQDQCGDRYPLIETLDFYENTIPELIELDNLELKNLDSDGGIDDGFLKIEPSGQFYLSPYGKRDAEPKERLKVLRKNIAVQSKKGTSPMYWWKDFDNLVIGLFEN
ncbi:hypothetical protein [Aquimarina sp. AU119]|uniref:hypothetical protein n=1 Tax=Aquimarina sp. AU119 TaxID=2108528 RepID=UPI000D699888|nr:hypothetical protein [Aquimarina sp. AU119]